MRDSPFVSVVSITTRPDPVRSGFVARNAPTEFVGNAGRSTSNRTGTPNAGIPASSRTSTTSGFGRIANTVSDAPAPESTASRWTAGPVESPQPVAMATADATMNRIAEAGNTRGMNELREYEQRTA